RTMENVTSPDAVEFVLHRYGLTCAPVDTRTIVVSKTRKWPESEMSVTSVVLAAEVKEAEQRANANKATSDSSKFDVVYRGESLYSAVMMLGQKAGLKILFEPTIEDPAKRTSGRPFTSDDPGCAHLYRLDLGVRTSAKTVYNAVLPPP